MTESAFDFTRPQAKLTQADPAGATPLLSAADLSMLFTLRLFLLGVHFLVAGAVNMLIVVNDQSNYDLFILGSVVPRRTVTIGKTSLRWIPIFGQIYWLAGNVLIERGNAAKAKAAVLKTTDTLQHHDTSIWVFPEGTRNLGKGLLPFKKGAFQMAIAAGVPIVPICSSNYKRTMRLNRWHSGNLRIHALSPISTVGLTLDDMPALMERCRGQMVACIDALDAAPA